MITVETSEIVYGLIKSLFILRIIQVVSSFYQVGIYIATILYNPQSA